MKILFVQLARLGDIYQTWPTLLATVRQNPEAEVHLLVRERFQGAAVGLPATVKVHSLPSASILGPVIRDLKEIDSSQSRLNEFLESLQAERFDKVVNLSFSPFSSYLNHFLGSDGAECVGYNRHPDGYFHMPDDLSAYFHAQVGIGRWNRYHLTEIFASMAGVQLESSDWTIPGRLPFFERVLPSDYIVMHVGASQVEKSWSGESWSQLIEEVLESSSIGIVLVGSRGEDAVVEKVVERHPQRVLNLVGKTRVPDLLFITQWANLCVGGDSVVMHAASLSGTPCLNLSCQSVNFWETGPVFPGSEVIWAPRMKDISVDHVKTCVDNMLKGQPGSESNARVSSLTGPVKYSWPSAAGSEFEWKLIQAMYSGEEVPILDDPVTFQALYRLRQLTELAMEKFNNTKGDTRAFVAILDSVDEAISKTGQLNDSAGIVVRWFTTEKSRLGPGDYQTLVDRTYQIYSDLNKICRVFVGDESYQFDQGEIYAE